MGHREHKKRPIHSQQPQAQTQAPTPAPASHTTFAGAMGGVPAPLQDFRTPGASASEQAYGEKDEDERMDDAAQGVKMPLPKTRDQGHGTAVSAEQAPTIEDVMDPTRPAVEGGSEKVVLGIIQNSVNDLYNDILLGELSKIQGLLSKTAPVPKTPMALKLLEWVVEQVATAAVGHIGSFIGKELFEVGAEGGEGGEGEAKAAPTVMSTWKEKALDKGTDIAKDKLGESIKENMLESGAESGEESEASEGNMLEEFMTREHHMLVAKKGDITARLMLMHDKASGPVKADTSALQNKLRDLIGSPSLTAWFHSKVAMEWINFAARVSLGPRAEDQKTDLKGANEIDGIQGDGIRQWMATDGMIEVVLDMPSTVNGIEGVKFERAGIPSSYGAAQILKHLKGYNLGNMPVYRRVRLKTGKSKLDEAPAFVITPEGNVETDVANPALAAIGRGRPTHLGETMHMPGSVSMTDEDDRQDPMKIAQQHVDAALAVAGADLAKQVLYGISPEVLK